MTAQFINDLRDENRKLRQENVMLQGVNEELGNEIDDLLSEREYWPTASSVMAGVLTAIVLGLAFYGAIFLAIWIGTKMGVGQ